MAQYGIGVSGLNAFSEAIDVTSNNISNSQTIGYKAAEFVFSDQFFKSTKSSKYGSSWHGHIPNDHSPC